MLSLPPYLIKTYNEKSQIYDLLVCDWNILRSKVGQIGSSGVLVLYLWPYIWQPWSNLYCVIVLSFIGSHTMALLEKLEPGNVYLVKIAASSEVGEGPFSEIVELAPKRGNVHRSKNPRHSDWFPDSTGQTCFYLALVSKALHFYVSNEMTENPMW